MCWFGRGTYPEKIRYCIDSWKRILPDYEVMLWDEASEKYSRILKAGEVWFLKGRVREGRENSAPNVWGMVFKRFSPDGKELEQ